MRRPHGRRAAGQFLWEERPGNCCSVHHSDPGNAQKAPQHGVATVSPVLEVLTGTLEVLPCPGRPRNASPPLPMVRPGGLEPPHPSGHQDLNLARLPIPPRAPGRPRTGPPAQPADRLLRVMVAAPPGVPWTPCPMTPPEPRTPRRPPDPGSRSRCGSGWSR